MALSLLPLAAFWAQLLLRTGEAVPVTTEAATPAAPPARCANRRLIPPAFPNGQLVFPEQRKTDAGVMVPVVCDDGFVAEGVSMYLCFENPGTGKVGWFPPTFDTSCVETQRACRKGALNGPGGFANGRIRFQSTSSVNAFVKIDDTASVTCDANARLSGVADYTCVEVASEDSDGWAPDFDAVCTVVCPEGDALAKISGYETCLLIDLTAVDFDHAKATCAALSTEPHKPTMLPLVKAESQLGPLARALRRQGYTDDVWLDPESTLDGQQLCFGPDPLFEDQLLACLDVEVGLAGDFQALIGSADCEQPDRYALCQLPELHDTHHDEGHHLDLCPEHFFPYGDLCYFVSKDRLSQPAAEELCNHKEAAPAMPKTQAQLDNVQAFLSDFGKSAAWLGLRLFTDERGDHCVSWLDGTPTTLAMARRLGLGEFCPALRQPRAANGTIARSPAKLLYRDCAASAQGTCARSPDGKAAGSTRRRKRSPAGGWTGPEERSATVRRPILPPPKTRLFLSHQQSLAYIVRRHN